MILCGAMASNGPSRPRFLFLGLSILVAGVLLRSPPLDCGEPDARPRQEEPAGDGGEPLPPTERESAPPEGPGEGRVAFENLLARLRRDFPDREAVVRGGDAVPRALLEFAEEHAEDAARADAVGQARQLAAEAYMVMGRRAEALRLYGDLASAGPLDAHRALALFVLGEDQFLRERYLSSGGRRGADYYWSLLSERFPDSDWARRAERPMRYLGFLKGGRPTPAFTGVFERASAPGEPLEKRSYSAEGLRGQVVLLEFWTAADPGRGDRIKTLAAGLASNLKEYPDLAGKVQALGVNLDTTREPFDAAIAVWDTPWPELHDGQGFRTPLAEVFAIPRAPHWVVIEASGGRVVYIGSDFDRFLAIASQELRRVRGISE